MHIGLQFFRCCFALPHFRMLAIIPNLLGSEKCLTRFEKLMARAKNEPRSSQKKNSQVKPHQDLCFYHFSERINLFFLLGALQDYLTHFRLIFASYKNSVSHECHFNLILLYFFV